MPSNRDVGIQSPCALEEYGIASALSTYSQSQVTSLLWRQYGLVIKTLDSGL